MRKIVFFAAMMFLCGRVSADSRNFQESRYNIKGKMIDSLYVDSVEGLNIRAAGSMKARKIATISHQMRVKPVSVGEKVTIDGIEDYWVEILVPRYLWTSGEPEYGWVFGGYLKRDRPENFPTEHWTKHNLEDYLTTYLSWGFFDKHADAIGFMHFYKDGKFSEIHPRPGDPGFRDDRYSSGEKWYGQWKALDGRTFEVSAVNDRTKERFSRTVILEKIYHDVWINRINSEGEATLFTHKNTEGWANFEVSTIRDGSILKSKSLYLNDCWGQVNLRHTYITEEDYTPPDELVMEYIKAGVNVDYDMYNSYWDEVTEEKLRK